jgi:hypothetical protein
VKELLEIRPGPVNTTKSRAIQVAGERNRSSRFIRHLGGAKAAAVVV